MEKMRREMEEERRRKKVVENKRYDPVRDSTDLPKGK